MSRPASPCGHTKDVKWCWLSQSADSKQAFRLSDGAHWTSRWLPGECVGFWKPLGELCSLCPVLPRAALNPALSGRTHYWSIIYFPERHFGDLAVMPSRVAWCSANSLIWVNHTVNSIWKHSIKYFRRLKSSHMARVWSLKSFKFPMSLFLAGGGCAWRTGCINQGWMISFHLARLFV